jgi:adenylate cyclase
VAVGVLAVGLLVVSGLWLRARQRTVADAVRIQQLEADLDAALRPRPPATPTERAVSRVIRTVSKVREHGIAGLLQASIEDLQVWAQEERADILTMADADGRVTLFFSDIEDSTPLNHRLGDEAWVRLLAAHDSLVRGCVDKYRGQVVKTAGDGFMVAFRDAEAACRAALAIQKNLDRTLDQRLRQVRVRIGIHTGTVVSRDGDYFGRNVAIAARVGDLASGGEVLATDAVREAMDDDAAVILEDAGEVELKGLPGSYVIYRVLRRPR